MKPRSQSLLPAAEVAHRKSEEAMQHFGAQQSRLSAAERQLAELRRYREEYAGHADGGVPAHLLQNRRHFVDRIDEAISQQIHEIARRQRMLDLASAAWREALARERALESVIERASERERTHEERREQRDIDERMQHRTPPRTRHT